MAAEARVYQQLFSFSRFCKLEQKYAGRKVINIRQPERREGCLEFSGNDSDVEGGEPLFHGAGWEEVQMEERVDGRRE